MGMLLDATFPYDQLPCGFLCFRPDGLITLINQPLLSWLKVEAAQVVYKRRFSELLSVGGRLYYQMVITPQLFRQRQVNEINFDVGMQGQNTFPALCNLQAVPVAEGEMALFAAVIIKITDRKKLETALQKDKRNAETEKRRFETLANIIPDIVWTAKSNGRIDFVNDRFLQKFKFSRRSLRQSQLSSLFSKEDRKRLYEQWKLAFVKAMPFEAEAKIRMPDRSHCWYLIRAAPYINEHGNVEQWFGAATDIHLQKEQQLATIRMLSDSLSEAGELISLKDVKLKKISYYQSHAVRKPLANILGLLQMMDFDNISEIKDLIVPMLKNSAEELDEMIRSMAE